MSVRIYVAIINFALSLTALGSKCSYDHNRGGTAVIIIGRLMKCNVECDLRQSPNWDCDSKGGQEIERDSK